MSDDKKFRVRCIDATGYMWLKEGEEYDAIHDTLDDHFRVLVKNFETEAPEGRYFLKSRFVIVPKNEPVASTNPKDLLGIKKPHTFLVPPALSVHVARAMEDGARKYGPYNWRQNKVLASIYLSAAERHIKAWQDGENNAKDSGVHHLGHAAACLAILLDAEATGNLIDDRPTPGAYGALIDMFTKK